MFSLEVEGLSLGSFPRVSGIGSETEVIEFKQTGPDGRMIIRKVPGATKWSEIVLERRMDVSRVLWDWRQQVIDGDVDLARRDGAVVAYDASGLEVARWSFTGGWPSKITGVDVDEAREEPGTERVTIVHEGLVRG
jgi:phage tail-like protein